MLKSRVVWGLCLAGAFLFLVFSDESLALMLFILTVAVPVIAIGMNQIAARKIFAGLELPQMGEKGQQIVCRIKGKNGRRLPVAPIRCRLHCENLSTGEELQQEVLFPIGAKTKCDVPFVLASSHCGCIRVSVEELCAYDIFGLVPVQAPHGQMAETTVLPVTFAPQLTVMAHLAKDIEADEYSQERPGFDPSETFAIREYHPGDSIRRIHWKLSGKFDELLIKEAGLPVRHSFLVLFETSQPATAGRQADVKDALNEIMMSLCQAMTEEDITYEVGWQDHDAGKFFHTRVTNLDELAGIADKMLRARCITDGADAISCFRESYEENKFEHIMYVSSFLPAHFEEFSNGAFATGIICTEDESITALTDASGNISLHFCSPENYEKELFALAI